MLLGSWWGWRRILFDLEFWYQKPGVRRRAAKKAFINHADLVDVVFFSWESCGFTSARAGTLLFYDHGKGLPGKPDGWRSW